MQYADSKHCLDIRFEQIKKLKACKMTLTVFNTGQTSNFSLYVRNLIPVWLDPNDISSTADSDVKLYQSDSIHSRNSHVGHSKIIHGSTQMRCDLFTPFHQRSLDFNLGSSNVSDNERETCVKKASSTLFNLVRGWMSSCARVCSGRFLLWLCDINISLNILAQPRMLLKKLR